MKKTTKILSTILAVVMLFSVMSVNCFAAESRAVSDSLIIDEYVSVGEYAGADITTLVVEEGCEYIDSYAFALCENLETVIINSKYCYFEPYTFLGCNNLKKITIVADNEFLTSDEKGIVYDQEMSAVHYVPAKSIGNSYTIPENVEIIHPGAFADCSEFSLTLPKNYEGLGGSEFMDIRVSEFKVNPHNPYFKSIDGVLFSKSGTELIKYPINCDKVFYEIPDDVTYIYPQAFISQNFAVLAALESGIYADLDDKNLFYVTDNYLNLHMSEDVAESVVDDEYSYMSILGLDEICVEGLTTDEAELLNEYTQAYIDEYEAQYEEFLEEAEPGTAEYEYLLAMCCILDRFMPVFNSCDNVHNVIVDYYISSYPHKYTYAYKTESLDLSGLQVMITTLDGSKSLAVLENWDESDYTVTGFNNMQTGVQTVTVETDDFSVEFEVEVAYTWWQWLINIFLFGWIWY